MFAVCGIDAVPSFMYVMSVAMRAYVTGACPRACDVIPCSFCPQSTRMYDVLCSFFPQSTPVSTLPTNQEAILSPNRERHLTTNKVTGAVPSSLPRAAPLALPGRMTPGAPLLPVPVCPRTAARPVS